MASGNAQLNFAIRAINEASKTLKEVDADIEGLSKSAEKGGGLLGKMGGALADVGKIAGGFILSQGLLKLPGLLTDMAKSAAADDAATRMLDNAIANLGKTTGASAATTAQWRREVDAAIVAGQRLAFTDDDIRESYESLIVATGSHEEALKRQKIAMDIARQTGMDLNTVARLTGRITDETVNVFTRYGIVLDKTATEQEALGALQAKFGGQAEEYARSTAGQFEASKIAIAEAREEIGYYLLPVMATFGKVLADEVLPRVAQFIAYLGEHIVPKVSAMVEVFETKFVPAFRRDVLPHMETFWRLMRDEIIPAVTDLAASIAGTLFPQLSILGGWFKDHTEVLVALLAAWATYVVVITTASAVATIHTEVTKGLAVATKALATAQAILNGTMAVNPAVLIAIALAALVAVAVLVVKHWDEINAVLQKFGGPIVSYVVEKIGEFTDFARDKFNGFRGVVESAFDAVDGFFDALGDKVGQFARWVNQHLGTIIFILGGPFLYAIVKWRNEIGSAVMFVVDKMIDFAEMMRGPVVGTVKAVVGDIIAYFTTMKDIIVFAVETIVSIIKWQIDWYRDMWNAAEGLRNAVVSAFGYMRDRVVDYMRDMLWPIQAFIDLAQTAWSWGQRIGGFIGGAFGQFSGALDRGVRAEGGPVNAGGMYIVGERGPELFSPSTSGTIIPNHAISGGGGMTIHYHQHGPVFGMLDLRSQVLEFVRDGIRGGGLRGVV